MVLEFVHLLHVQRDIYRLPRGMERFRTYIRTMVDAESGDIELPLVAMNPMGKAHVAALLDVLLDMQADTIGEAAVASAAVREEVLTATYRAAHVQQHGVATTLAQMLRQRARPWRGPAARRRRPGLALALHDARHGPRLARA